MSTASNVNAPITRRVRAYFAPVDRNASAPTLFDPAQTGDFALDAPPSPWIDLGWCNRFARKSGEGLNTGIAALRTGAPATVTAQVRTFAEATVELEFASWGKLQLALACGTQQMNLLSTTSSAAANASGGTAAAAVPLQPGSTATALQVGTAAQQFTVGSFVAVDVDYTNQTGYIGSGVSGAYLRSSSDAGGDANYIRRVSLNVARITSIANGALQLDKPLLAGAPAAGMQVCSLVGFVDREGSSFFQEWSALFVMEGEQGDRVIFHYPRLQAMRGAAETAETLAAPLDRIRLACAFRALPVRDANDGEQVLCFRSYLPA
ncbi:hypothetical protein [Edaphobacter flagellatus]|uniref:hypothetical protein n=1 Tax=Edaphobacter flagellatus TaxID=1933044 RepID=UPI0021B25330|nr:hypothetical protein [Edaphobacter flagellatus]